MGISRWRRSRRGGGSEDLGGLIVVYEVYCYAKILVCWFVDRLVDIKLGLNK